MRNLVLAWFWLVAAQVALRFVGLAFSDYPRQRKPMSQAEDVFFTFFGLLIAGFLGYMLWWPR